MTHLSLSLLGHLRVTLDGEPVTGFESSKVRALLAYLAVEADRPHSREILAGLLWPDFPDRSALSNFRYALSNLRKAIGDRDAQPPFLLITNEAIQFNKASDYDLDVQAFTENDEDNPIDRLGQTIGLYHGPFLEGFVIADSVAFEEWVVIKREQLERRMIKLLRRLAEHYEERGEYEQAQQYAWRMVELEPWFEEGHQQLMRLLALGGQRSVALAQYETCRRLLAEELGVEPAAETTALYEHIRDGVFLSRPPRISLPDFLNEQAQPVEVEQQTFVGSETELARLDKFLDKALVGHGQIAFITGELGSGKTMLLQEFAKRAMIAHQDLIVASGNCNAYTGSGDPYLPFLEIMAMLTGDVEAMWFAGALPREHAQRLWTLLPDVISALMADSPELIDRFVSGSALLARARIGAKAQASQLDEFLERRSADSGRSNVQQTDLFEQYTKVLQALARKRPMVLVVDDLQWADTGSIHLLFHLGQRLAGKRILLLGAYRLSDVTLGRAGERHPLEPVVNELQSDYGEVGIKLAQTGNRSFVDALLDSEPNHLGTEFRDALFRHTGGYPLFTVELLRGLQERGDLTKDESGHWIVGQTLDWETLPARVEAVIAERIGRLPAALQTTLAIASVEGENFTAQAVSRVQKLDDQEVIRDLSGSLSKQHRLVSAAGFQRLDGGAISSYRFQHFLFQKFLYNRLDEVERSHLHEAMGNALEGLYGERSSEIAIQLARHFEIAGLADKAAVYLNQAGDRDVRLFAYAEAINHYQRALNLLLTCSETTVRANQELRLRIALGVPLLAAHGFGDLELEQNYARARELTKRAEATPELFQVLSGLKSYYDVRLSLDSAIELSEDMLKLADHLNAPALRLFANHQMSCTVLYLGQLITFLEYRRRATEMYNREQYRTLVFRLGLDPEVAGLSHAGWAEWFLGYSESARQKSREALAWADELGHPFMRAFAMFFAAMLYCYLGDVDMTSKLAEETVVVSRELGMAFWQAAGTILTGWVLAEGDRLADAISRYQEAFTTLRMIGVELGYVQCIPLLAEAYAKADMTIEGLALVEEGLNKVYAAKYWMVEPDLYNCKGKLLLATGKEAEAETCFWQAIESARRMEGKSWELRAVLSLCRLWYQQSKYDAAYQLLHPLYSWFTEGFDTRDLKEATSLLNELDERRSGNLI